MSDATAAFELRAASLLNLRTPHRQYDEAIAAITRFERSAAPRLVGGPDAGGPVEAKEEDDERDDRGLDFLEDDDGDDVGDAHVQALMIVGPPGTGKSGCLAAFMERPEHASDFDSGYTDRRPVIRFDTPDLPTPKEMVREISAQLRQPVKRDWTRGEIARHFRKLFRDVGLRYILMDEAHVLVENLTARQVTLNARFLKFLLVSCRVPIILAGEPPLEELLGHPALKRRMHAPIRLGPYVWNNYDEVREWMGLTGALASHLGFPESRVAVDVETAARLYLDADGIVGLLAKRLIEAGRLAQAEGGSDIDSDVLSRSWRQWTASTSKVASDPFAIVEAATTDLATDPYAADTDGLKALWTARFHPAAPAIDTSRSTRRANRKPAPNTRSFGR